MEMAAEKRPKRVPQPASRKLPRNSRATSFAALSLRRSKEERRLAKTIPEANPRRLKLQCDAQERSSCGGDLGAMVVPSRSEGEAALGDTSRRQAVGRPRKVSRRSTDAEEKDAAGRQRRKTERCRAEGDQRPLDRHRGDERARKKVGRSQDPLLGERAPSGKTWKAL